MIQLDLGVTSTGGLKEGLVAPVAVWQDGLRHVGRLIVSGLKVDRSHAKDKSALAAVGEKSVSRKRQPAVFFESRFVQKPAEVTLVFTEVRDQHRQVHRP